MPPCGVTRRPGPWLWIRPTSRRGGGCATANRSSTPTPTRRRRRIIRSRRRIRTIRMPAGAGTTSRTPRPGTVVHVARAMNLSPAGSHKGIGGLPAVHALGDTIGKPRQLIADRAYNYVTNDTFALPVWQLGYTTIYDLHPKQRGTHPGPDGSDTLWIDGVLYPTSLPAGLHDIEPIDTKMDAGVRGRLDRRHQARQAYAFVPHGARQPDGSRRYRGPAVPPARVRCPNNPVSMRAPHSVPTTSCTSGTPCGCGRTITLSDADYPDLRMPFQQ